MNHNQTLACSSDSGENDPIDYVSLADFRFAVRTFFATSERLAHDHGLTPQQHQALLAIAGCPDDERPTVGYVASRLLLEHHSAVGLINRLEELGLVERQSVQSDRRQVEVALTNNGIEVLRQLSSIHRHELRARAPFLVEVLSRITGPGARHLGARGDKHG